jgi:hypothetical protein
MALSTFQGPVRSLNGFYSTGPGTVINLPNNTNTITLDVPTYAGRIIRTNDATLVITLPTLDASADPASAGPGSDPNSPNNMGVSFTFLVQTAATTWKVITAASQYLLGSALVIDTDTTDTVNGFAANGTSIRSVNLNGTTTGGIAGSYVTFTALTATQWLVSGVVIGSGTIATPFATS